MVLLVGLGPNIEVPQAAVCAVYATATIVIAGDSLRFTVLFVQQGSINIVRDPRPSVC